MRLSGWILMAGTWLVILVFFCYTLYRALKRKEEV
jgi:hypothetical protein